MKRPTIGLLTLFILYIFACDNEQYKEYISPYAQENIEWPSLADTPWPIYNHDVQNTNRSEYAGPVSTPTVNSITYDKYFYSSFSVDEENNLYINSPMPGMEYLTYINNNYEIHYLHPMPNSSDSYVTPILTNDGYVYSIGYESYLYKYDRINDEVVFEIDLDDNVSITPLIDKEGSLIIPGQYKLQKFDKEGNRIWEINLRAWGSGGMSPAGDVVYFCDNYSTLTAVDVTTGEILNTFVAQTVSGPTISNEGDLFLANDLDTSFVCLDADFSIKWQYHYGRNGGKSITFETGTLDYDGNYYTTGLTTEGERELLSFSYDGLLNWIVPLSHKQGPGLLSDINNNVYVSGFSGQTPKRYFSSYSQEGELHWSVETPYQFYETPVILSDGRIALPAIRATVTNLVIIE